MPGLLDHYILGLGSKTGTMLRSNDRSGLVVNNIAARF